MKRYNAQWPNPSNRMMAKMLLVVYPVAGSGMAAYLWAHKEIGFTEAALWVLVLGVSILPVVAVVVLVKLREVAILRVDALVIDHPFTREVYPWRDVVSVSLEQPRYATPLGRWIADIFLGSDKDKPCVHIVVGRNIRFNLWPFLWKDTTGPRVRGLAVPGSRIVRKYLDDAEGFVREAQQFLTNPDV